MARCGQATATSTWLLARTMWLRNSLDWSLRKDKAQEACQRQGIVAPSVLTRNLPSRGPPREQGHLQGGKRLGSTKQFLENCGTRRLIGSRALSFAAGFPFASLSRASGPLISRSLRQWF